MRLFKWMIAVLILAAQALAHEGSHRAVPPWQQASPWPDRIVTTLGEDPATSFSVTWRTDKSVGLSIAQIAVAEAAPRFDLSAETIRAEVEPLDLEMMRTEHGMHESVENLGIDPVHYHSVTFQDLEPDTLYAYRVRGARGAWSEWVQTRTAARSGPVKFVYFGDAQIGLLSHWSRVIRMANQTVPDADFFLHAGDLVNFADNDMEWAEWFKAGGFIHSQTPVVPVTGNHEFITIRQNGMRDGPRVLGNLWRPQFTLPTDDTLPASLQETVYDIRYSPDLHLFVLNSTDKSYNIQAQWLDKKLSESDARWKIVSLHHPFFSPPVFDRRESDAQRRAAFSPIIKKHKVDMVLAGHIHFYSRITGLKDKGVTSRSVSGPPRDVETVYVISSSGAKMSTGMDPFITQPGYGDGKADWDNKSLDRSANNAQLYQVINIDGDRLEYESRTAVGDLYDGFVLEKAADGRKRLTEGAVAFGEPRLFENTSDYRDWYDLK